MPYQCFFMERVPNRLVRSLRRYSDTLHCPGGQIHDAERIIDTVDAVDDGYEGGSWDGPPHNDPLWPTHCSCGYQFQESDVWQANTHRLYRRTDTGQEMRLRDAPVGALWYATWLEDTIGERGSGCGYYHAGPDGRVLECRTPGGEWIIDSRCSNCTMRDDNVHHCWVRHGDPKAIPCTLHVDKNGVTCQAGAGSIQRGSYHGFLHNGFLTD